ncbi:MAG: cslA, partial [Rariglobus sp.]|nr:cslA [Rariglobus sp.]
AWNDIDYIDRSRGLWKPREHLVRTQKLALQAITENDETSAGDAIAAIDWWITHDPSSSNWWHNQIGAPRLLVQSLLLLGDRLPPTLRENSRKILERSGEFILREDGVTRDPTTWTGANRLWICAIRLLTGTLFRDETLIRDSLAGALQEIRVAAHNEEGIQVDGSFHQHGPLLYNGGYGAAFVDECRFFLENTHGTVWQPDLAYHRLLANFLLDGTRWLLRGADLNPCCRGREIVRPRANLAPFADFAAFLSTTGIERAAEAGDLAAAIRAACAPGNVTGNRMFFRSDVMVQQDTRAALSVRMYSERTFRSESINGEGLRSHHLADGFTYLTATGVEYRDIFPVWDWQKLPGTTCLQTPSLEPPDTVTRRAATAVVGGVSDGHFGACMQIIADDRTQAAKSWFFGPEGMACLGAGIRGLTEGEVITTLDQSLLQGPVEHDRSSVPLPCGEHALSGVRWLRHGPWGFFFPTPTDVMIAIGTRSGSWSRIGTGTDDLIKHDVFLASLDHGRGAAPASYAYLVVPAASPETLSQLTAEPPFEIVAHTSDQQAIWWPAVKRLQAAFFTAGTVTWSSGLTLQVSRACCVQLQSREDGRWQLTLADICQKGGVIEVELLDCAGGILGRDTLIMPEGMHAGSTISTDF